MSRDEEMTESRLAPPAPPLRGVSAVADRKALESALEFSLVRGDIAFRLQRRIGLIPPDSLGVARRALLLAAVTWLPLAVWALVHGRALPGGNGEPLLQHFGVNVRCLVAIPLFILGEAPAQHVITQFLLRMLDGGFVTEADMPRFRSIIARAVRLRDAWLPWVILLGFVVMWSAVGPPAGGVHEVAWATEGDPAHPVIGFGGWWFLYVVRAMFVTLLLVWLWRFVLGCIVVARIMRLDLQLVPSHPDHAMGLGLVDRIPRAFQAFSRRIATRLRGTAPAALGVSREDVYGALASFWLVFVSSIPAALPFLFIDDAWIALRVSNTILLGLLFLVGYRWAKYTTLRPWRAGLGLLVIGVILVLVAIRLGG